MKQIVFLLVFFTATTSLAERYQNGHAEFRNSSLHNNSYNNSYDKGVDVVAKTGFVASFSILYLVSLSIVQVNGRVTILEKTRDSGVIIRVVFDNVSGYCFSFYPRFKP